MARKKTTSGDKPSPATPLTHPAGTERLNEIAHVLYQLAFKIELKAQATDTHSQPLGAFRFSELQRQVLLSGLKLPKSLTAKLSRRTSVLTTEEVTGLTMSLSHLLTAESQRLASLLQMGQHLADQLQQELASPSTARQRSRGAARKKADPQAVFQFKISLSRMRPAVWRRIQVRDCTLDQL
ncbi:MAG: hypothetical protein JSS02_19865, partial [Planctomycetes bacterium]|nr:hypothetical protein [Planctomycetota bacterium]